MTEAVAVVVAVAVASAVAAKGCSQRPLERLIVRIGATIRTHCNVVAT